MRSEWNTGEYASANSLSQETKRFWNDCVASVKTFTHAEERAHGEINRLRADDARCGDGPDRRLVHL